MMEFIKSDGWAFAFKKEDEDILLKIISSLSDKYLDGKIFLPHITCFRDTKSSKLRHDKLINSIKKIKPFEIKLNKISFEKRIFKTLFIEVEPSHQMTEVVNIFEKEFDQIYDFNPHISLIYKEELDYAEREKLSNSLKFPINIKVNALLRYTNDSFANNFANWETERIDFD